MLSKCFNIRKGIGEEPVILILLFFNAMMDNCIRNLFSDVRDALIGAHECKVDRTFCCSLKTWVICSSLVDCRMQGGSEN